MTSIFVFALVVGGGLLALSFLGDLFGAGDADLDTDLDTDIQTDGPDDAADLAGAFRIFTIRNLTYFLFGFGAVGWLLGITMPGAPLLVILAAAVFAGVVGAGLATLAFGWVKATDAGYQPGEGSFVGCEGRVILPVGHGRMGQIVVRRADREHELRALPFDGSAAAPAEWRNVIVIEMDGGTALVSPMEALAPAESEPADH